MTVYPLTSGSYLAVTICDQCFWALRAVLHADRERHVCLCYCRRFRDVSYASVVLYSQICLLHTEHSRPGCGQSFGLTEA